MQSKAENLESELQRATGELEGPLQGKRELETRLDRVGQDIDAAEKIVKDELREKDRELEDLAAQIEQAVEMNRRILGDKDQELRELTAQIEQTAETNRILGDKFQELEELAAQIEGYKAASQKEAETGEIAVGTGGGRGNE